MEFLYVGVGGALGALARYQLGKMISAKAKSSFPVGTFIINITGAILLGLACGLGTGGNLYLLLADGFLGAYTTFSTFMYEGFDMFRGNKRKNAVVYVAGSFIIGVAGFVLGYGINILV
ncbi:MAG: fluoride efflux transporter CrcB [Clostridiales bacterium]|nr:fluoride efflux transporter CrcB [Clostridiales bacterium]